MKKFKVAGILGGLGPEATKNLYERILEKTKARVDQDNIPMLIFNNPQIPDRSNFLLNNKENPEQELIKTAQTLEKAGADFIVMPCNTAHYFMNTVAKSISIPFINIIDLTSEFISQKFPNKKKAGLLITTGSKRTNMYTESLQKFGISAIYPEENLQKKVMDAIYKVKANKKKEARKILKHAAKELKKKGAEVIIMGCTEIPLVLEQKDINIPLINPIEILADKTILESRGY